MPEALRNLQAALATRPGTPYLYCDLGRVLDKLGRPTEAASYYLKAVQLAPKDEILRMSLGDLLARAGRLAEASEQFEHGLELTRDATVRLLLWKKLLRCRLQLEDIDEADELWRRSLETDPPNHERWDGYAEFCLYHGHQDGYRTTCRGLIEHFGAAEDPWIAWRTGQTCLLSPVSGEVMMKATALIDRALESKKPKPEWIQPHFMFAKGLAQYRQGRLESAISIMDGPASEALQSAPRFVSAMSRYRLGRKEEALRMFAAAILSGDWRKSHVDDREKWIFHVLRREAETIMLPNLRTFLEGSYQPRTKDEKLCLLGACQFEGQYRKAAEIYSDVLLTDAHLADDLNAKTRFIAACIAAALGSGRGLDAGGLDEAGRLRWRNQARDWLRADLALVKKLSKSNAGGLREFLKITLKHWSTDLDLAALRDPNACQGLLPEEQKAFQDLCDQLRILTDETKD